MTTTMAYGGWVADQPPSTGGPLGIIRLIGWLAATSAAMTCVGTGGELSLAHFQRATSKAQHIAPIINVANIRTPSDDLMRIREVLHPAVSDLAATLSVSRQSIYNWRNGEAVAEDNAAKLRDLAQAADVLAENGVPINAALLKRKFMNGKNLLQVSQAGESAREAALLLVQIHNQETAQRERLKTRFANRTKSSATADFDLPTSNDHA